MLVRRAVPGDSAHLPPGDRGTYSHVRDPRADCGRHPRLVRWCASEASRRLIRRLGFREVGVYEKHGKLDGAWRDVVIVERLLI